MYAGVLDGMISSSKGTDAGSYIRSRAERWLVPRGMADVSVRFMPLTHDPCVSRLCAAVLSAEERVRAERFGNDTQRGEFYQRRAFQRFCGAETLGDSHPLAAVRFDHDDKGRPSLADCPGLWFSFASCASGLLAAWSGQAAIGVDIEQSSDRIELEALAATYYTDRERLAITAAGQGDKQRLFYRLWCLKEAALKSVGEGLPYGIDQFEFGLQPLAHVRYAPDSFGGAPNFQVYEWSGPPVYAALVRRRL